MDRLLVASDLSARSDRALARAAQLASAHQAKLTALHVVDDDLPAHVAAQMRSTAEDSMRAALSAAGAPEAEVIVADGTPVATLLEAAERVSADLVVVGTHRSRPLWDMFSGTTVERLARMSACPVLLVTEPVDGPYRSVLCGIDLSPACATAGNFAVQLAPDAAFATFHAVHVPYRGLLAPNDTAGEVVPFVKEARGLLKAWWPTAGLSDKLPEPEVSTQSIFAAFDQARRTNKAQLFALGAHGRTALSPSLLGSFAESLIREPQCDLLIVRGPRSDM